MAKQGGRARMEGRGDVEGGRDFTRRDSLAWCKVKCKHDNVCNPAHVDQSLSYFHVLYKVKHDFSTFQLYWHSSPVPEMCDGVG